MRNANPACGFLFCVAALAAYAGYDSESLNGNLQNQCKNFAAAVAKGTSFTVSAECNEDGEQGLNSTKFDLSGDVRWDTNNHTLSWDTALSDSVTDIADKCMPRGASPFTVSATDVTLALSCSISVTDGTPRTANASLALNTNLQAGTDGELSRR